MYNTNAQLTSVLEKTVRTTWKDFFWESGHHIHQMTAKCTGKVEKVVVSDISRMCGLSKMTPTPMSVPMSTLHTACKVEFQIAYFLHFGIVAWLYPNYSSQASGRKCEMLCECITFHPNKSEKYRHQINTSTISWRIECIVYLNCFACVDQLELCTVNFITEHLHWFCSSFMSNMHTFSFHHTTRNSFSASEKAPSTMQPADSKLNVNESSGGGGGLSVGGGGLGATTTLSAATAASGKYNSV